MGNDGYEVVFFNDYFRRRFPELAEMHRRLFTGTRAEAFGFASAEPITDQEAALAAEMLLFRPGPKKVSPARTSHRRTTSFADDDNELLAGLRATKLNRATGHFRPHGRASPTG
jgi:hypothetical protein